LLLCPENSARQRAAELLDDFDLCLLNSARQRAAELLDDFDLCLLNSARQRAAELLDDFDLCLLNSARQRAQLLPRLLFLEHSSGWQVPPAEDDVGLNFLSCLP
jgi:hypothetical protein